MTEKTLKKWVSEKDRKKNQAIKGDVDSRTDESKDITEYTWDDIQNIDEIGKQKTRRI